MRLNKPVKIFFLFTLFILHKAYAQSNFPDTSRQVTSIQKAIKIYHQSLSPETNLYNGSEYTYDLYYPFTINEGDPFFQTKQFDTGTVFYNNVMYERVPLLYDLVHEELLTKDPSAINIIRLNSERIQWFIMLGHTFIRLIKDSTSAHYTNTGFYELLYKGNTFLYKKITKTLKENSASFQGVNVYIAESNEYFIMKDKQYYRVDTKKSLLKILSSKKNEISQFIRKNKLNIKRNKDDSFVKIVAYYDRLIIP